MSGTLEDTDGIWVGGVVGAEFGRFAFVASGARGDLTPPTDGSAIERDVGRITALGRVAILQWLHVDAQYAARVFSTSIGRQRWDMLGFGAMARHRLGDTGVVAFYRAEYLPTVRVEGSDDPDVNIAADVGLRAPLPGVPLEVVATYRIERFDFPERAGPRTDQFQYLQIYLGTSLRRAGGRWVLGGS